MLLDLDRLLFKKANIIWVVYHKLVLKELIHNGVDKKRIELIDIRFPYLKKPIIINKIMNKILDLLFKEKIIKHYLNYMLKKIDKKYNPKLWVTDTTDLLSEIEIASPKLTTLHSVTYKNFYLNLKNINYDILLFPGNYHKSRFKSFHSNIDLSDKRLEVIGNLNISHLLDKNNKDKNNKVNLLKSYGLNPEWPLVIYAPTHDAFLGSRFFPENFGNQYNRLNEYAEFLKSINHNLIIKFHHFMIKNFESKKIKNIVSKSNVAIFKTFREHDTLEGSIDDLLNSCDIMIGDTSGILTTAIFLNKKIIFIEPGSNFNWEKADIEKKYRPGYICNTFNELVDSTILYNESDPFEEDRNNFIEMICYKKNENAYFNLNNIIMNFLTAKNN